jgi:hypothetical protein
MQRVSGKLEEKGYNPGREGGGMRWRSRESLWDFQREQGLPVTGGINEVTVYEPGVG